MTELRKGESSACAVCGRRVVVEEVGTSSTPVWCCGQPMDKSEGDKEEKKTASPGKEESAESN